MPAGSRWAIAGGWLKPTLSRTRLGYDQSSGIDLGFRHFLRIKKPERAVNPPISQSAATAHLSLSELLGALSHALDMVEGQPAGHCVRCCWIGVHVGQEFGLDDTQTWELY